MEKELRIALLSLAGVVLFGTIAYMILEGWNLVNSFYFVGTTLTTIGNGEIYPTHDITKIFTVLFAFSGIGIALYAMTKASEERMHSAGRKVLLFDFDGTICKPMKINWPELKKRVMEHYREKHHYEPSSKGLSHIMNEVAEDLGKEAVREVDGFWRDFEKQALKEIEPNEDVVNFIRQQEDRSLMIWSSNMSETVCEGLEKLGIEGKFSIVVGRDGVSRVKPNPEGWKLISAKMGLMNNEALLIGNSISDEKAAEAAHIRFQFSDDFLKAQARSKSSKLQIPKMIGKGYKAIGRETSALKKKVKAKILGRESASEEREKQKKK